MKTRKTIISLIVTLTILGMNSDCLSQSWDLKSCEARFLYSAKEAKCGIGWFQAVDYLGNFIIISAVAISGNQKLANNPNYLMFKV